MARYGVIDKTAGERMRTLILKAIRERGIEMPARYQWGPPNYKAFVCELLPDYKIYDDADRRFKQFVRGEAYLSPKANAYYRACYVLGIDPYTAGYDAVDPARIIKPERDVVKNVATVKWEKGTSKDAKRAIWLSCQRFRWLVFRGLKARQINPWPKGKRQERRWQGFVDHIAPTGRARRTFLQFINGEADLTPRHVLYWRLCRSLDIPPQKAAFVYYLKEGIDVDKL